MLGRGPYSVRMKRTTYRKLSKPLPDLWNPVKTIKIPKTPKSPKKRKFEIGGTWPEAYLNNMPFNLISDRSPSFPAAPLASRGETRGIDLKEG